MPRSELYAAVFAFEKTSSRPVAVFSDSKYFVDLTKCSRTNNLHAPNGDLWLRYWAAYDHKAGKVTVRKVKAHCKYQDVIDGVIHWKDFAGNAFADQIADQAAEAAKVPQSVTSAFAAIDAVAWRVQGRIAAIICVSFTKAADGRASKAHKAQRAAARAEQLLQPQPG